jgi:hypothetical protein
MNRVLELQSIQHSDAGGADQAWSTASLARCGTDGWSTYSLADCGGGIPKLY